MSEVTRIVEWKNRDLLSALEEMLDLVKQGRMTGLVFACKIDGKEHSVGLVGDYEFDVAPVLGISYRLGHLANVRLDAREDTPTAS